MKAQCLEHIRHKIMYTFPSHPNSVSTLWNFSRIFCENLTGEIQEVYHFYISFLDVFKTD